MTAIRVRRLDKLTEAEFKACKHRTMHSRGLMKRTLINYKENKPQDAYAYMIWRDDILVSWVLVFRQGSTGTPTWNAHFYTFSKYRRKGLGIALCKRIAKDFPDVTVWPWNQGSDKFFTHCKERTQIRANLSNYW